MWPWGHAAVAYLSYLAVARAMGRQLAGRTPAGLRPTLAALVGSQLPDLVDKPLAWTFEVLPAGRSLGHSLLAVAVVVPVLRVVLDRRHRPAVVALAVGWLSHLAADGLAAIVGWRPAELTYAVWPLLPLPAYSTEPSFLAHLRNLRLTGFVLLEFSLVALAVVVWYRRYADGRGGSDAPDAGST